MSNEIEEALRGAGRAVAEQVNSVPELRLAPAPARARQRRTWALRGHRWTVWAAPLTAMVVIAAVAVALVLARDAVGSRPAPPPAVNQDGPSATQLPRYYIATDTGTQAVVGDTRTGQEAGTIDPGAGHQIKGLTGSADGTAFVADLPKINSSQPSSFSQHELYRFRSATPGGAPLHRSPLTLTPALSGDEVEGFALSPDGTRLAVLAIPPGNYEWVLRIYSVATGKVTRQWTMPTGGLFGGGSGDNAYALAWTANGTELAFRHDLSQSATVTGVSVYLLDVTRPGKDLRAGSRIVTLQATGSQCVNLLLTPDGKTVICGNVSQGSDDTRCSTTVPPRIAEFSAATGRPTRVLYQHKGACGYGVVDLFWSSADGSAVLADVVVGGQPGAARGQFTEQRALYGPAGLTTVPLLISGYAVSSENNAYDAIMNGRRMVAF